MNPILRMVLLGIGLATLVVVAVGLLIPSGYEVTRSVTIDATPAEVQPWLADLTRWEDWSPWTGTDPGVEVAYGAVTAGTGASMTWSSGPAGGLLTLVGADPGRGVAYEMAFKGGKFPTEGTIACDRAPGGTEVTWTVQGDVGLNPFDRFMRMMLTSRLGSMFEEGLERLKVSVEKSAANPTAPTDSVSVGQ